MRSGEPVTSAPPQLMPLFSPYRHQKCRMCCKQLKNLSNVVKNRAVQVGRHGSAFRELQLLMLPLDDVL